MTTTRKHHALYDDLSAIIGSKYVSDDDFVLWAYAHDSSSIAHIYGKPQGIVVRPGCTDDVVEIVKLANQTLTPIVPRGGGLGIGGPLPGAPGRAIVVDMTRMDKIIDIDEENKIVIAEAGITECELATRVNERGWDILNTAFQPYYTTTLGGHISGASCGAGMHLGRSWNWKGVIGMKVVLPNGAVLETNRWNVNQDVGQPFRWVPAPDFTGFFSGTYGAFGIITEGTLRMFRLKKIKEVDVMFLDTFDDLWHALYELAEVDPYPCEYVFCPNPKTSGIMGLRDNQFGLIYGFEGRNEEEVELKRKTVHEICEKAGGGPGTEIEVKSCADLQKRVFKNMGTVATIGMWSLLELVVGRKDFPDVFKEHAAWKDKKFKEKGIEGRLTDFHLVFPIDETFISSVMLFYDDNDPELRKKVFELTHEFFDYINHRGYVSFESATGLSLATSTHKFFRPEFRNFLYALKKAVDPNNIMNPGLFGF